MTDVAAKPQPNKKIFFVNELTLVAFELLNLFWFPHHNIFLSILFFAGVQLFATLILYSIVATSYFRTYLELVLVGSMAVLANVFAEAMLLRLISLFGPHGFTEPMTAMNAIGYSFLLITGYGFPQAYGTAHVFVIVMMVYCWVLNVFLVARLITFFLESRTKQSVDEGGRV